MGLNIGEVLKTLLEPENDYDKFAVAVEMFSHVVGHSTKGKSGRFAKTICFFLRANYRRYCRVEVRAKRVNLGYRRRFSFSAVEKNLQSTSYNMLYKILIKLNPLAGT